MNRKKEFEKIWNQFIISIKNSKKLEKKTIYSFAKFYLDFNPNDKNKGDPVKNLDRKIRKWKENYDLGRTPQNNTIENLKEYCIFLDNTPFKHELLEDEDIEHWFD